MSSASPPPTAVAGAPVVGAVAELREVVRAAAAQALPLRLVGRGSWLDAGWPVLDAEPVVLAGLTGIVDYVPGDLTLTARAGTPLAEIERAAAAEGQMLALDPFGDPEGTLGATVATASAGPLAAAFGTPRDQLLGVEVVTGAGDVVRGGGRVVKNVAGFDLTRLMVGAWGTLGIITEATVRLRARPAVDETVALPIAGDAALAPLLDRVRAAPVAPIALELLDATLAGRVLPGAPGALLLARLAGNEELVAAQRAALAALGDLAIVDGSAWRRLRGVEPPVASVVRLSHRPSRMAETWRAALALARPLRGGVHATPGRGVARCILPSPDPEALARVMKEAAFPGTTIAERLAAPLRAMLGPPAAVHPLAIRVRQAFDPGCLLNRGILGEPIP